MLSPRKEKEKMGKRNKERKKKKKGGGFFIVIVGPISSLLLVVLCVSLLHFGNLGLAMVQILRKQYMKIKFTNIKIIK
jgi:hypothetical protein